MRCSGWWNGTTLAIGIAAATPASAQDAPVSPDAIAPTEAAEPYSPTLPLDAPVKPPLRIRVALGPQLQPGFPGNDTLRLNPMISIARTRGDTPFRFGAPGDGPSIALFRRGRQLEIGPTFLLTGRRRSGDLLPGLPVVDRTFEAGIYALWWQSDRVRLRGAVRRGVGGHNGWIAQLGADYVRRDADRWLVSLGPRVTLADAPFQRNWFGVSPEASIATGLPRYNGGSGLYSVGLTSRVNVELTRHWGLQAQALYERLIDDAARSPIIRRVDSQNQLSVGVGATYSFSIR